MKTKLPILCLLLVVCVGGLSGQTRKATPTPKSSGEPPLAPLTEAERGLDLQSVVANQPDFMADEVFFYGEGFGGVSAKRRVAHKGNRYLVDTGYVKVIIEPDKEIRLNDASKTFEEAPTGNQLMLGSGSPINPRQLASQKGVSFAALGTQMIDGHKCIKIEAKVSGQDSQVFLYAAEDLKYLIDP